MSEEIRNDERRIVTSVGNSWIVCKSKSHPGNVYYFNTLTGEAVWNLSNAEIEKAKHRTKHLEAGSKLTKCPEPKDKPPSIPVNNSEPLHSLSSEQFVRTERQSSVSTYSNVANNNATFCTPFNQIPGVLQATQIGNRTIEPISNFYHSNTTPPDYNPRVWAVPLPHTQPVFIGPGIAPVVNHNLGPLNVAYNHLPTSMPQHATGLVFNSFEIGNQSDNNINGTRTFYLRDFNHDQGAKKTINKNDLRQKLISKNILNHKSSTPGGPGLLKANPRNTDIAAHIASKFEGIHSNDLRTGLENRVESQLHKETSSKIDLEPLKSLAPSDSNLDAWYIVVDLQVLLHEFKFLTTLTDSDEKCHLMVPKRVMEELKKYINVTENIQSKRILRFLSQQIEIGYAFMAEEPSEVEDDSIAEAIYKTCKELLENKYHLVLLTNNDELFTKCSSSINIFRIEDIKSFLMENPNKQQLLSGPKKSFMSNELVNKIKIIVPNDAPQKISTISPVREYLFNSEENIGNNPKTPPKQNNTPDKTTELVILKHTVDAGIQTDLEDINASISMTNAVEKQRLNDDSNILPQNTKEAITGNDDSNILPQNTKEAITGNDDSNMLPQNTKEAITGNDDSNILCQNTKEGITGHTVPLVSNILDKKREIKLNRSTSHQPQVSSAENEKKQFKWRRRRKTSLQCQVNELIPSHNDQNMNTKNIESPETNILSNQIDKLPDRILNNNPTLGLVENKITDDSIESRESSIYAESRNYTTKENITIEETSMSSIISNSESNVDAESNFNNSANSVNHQLVYNGQPDKAMYEIDSITMEQYLRMKCDEWISRFIQIMEEVLSQVLQQEPPFVHDAMPPPWTLHEAAQCIAIKFCGHQDITVAANKLSNVLFQVSDAKGKITMNMKPYQYMQMYSYGVHLLGAIMEVATSCEDIQIAVESLNKLLHDIRNPNMDSSTNDTFNDFKNDNMSNNDVSAVHLDATDNTDDSSLHEQEVLPETDRNQTEEVETTKENPKKRKLSEEELQRPVKFIRNFDIPFPVPKSLSLQKSDTVNTIRSPVQLRNKQLLTHSHAGEQTNQKNVNEVTEKENDSDVPTNQPNIIRKFIICPELEEQLKMNYNSNNYEDDDLDYNESYDEYVADNYCSEGEHNDEQHNIANANQMNDGVDTNEDYEPEILKDDSLLRDENSKKFKYMMHELLQKIKNALSQVQNLCNQCYKKLKNPNQSTELKCQLRKIAERAHLHTIRLCRSLESMLDHETSNPAQSMSDLLGQADINIRHVDARLLFEYRITIANCKNHAEDFLSSIQNIISEIKRTV